MNLHRKLTLVLAVAAAALALGSIAWAAIPDAGGVIHGCYDKQSGAVRVTDTATNLPKGCANKETALDWNQRGPQGIPGPVGPPGPAGEPGADLVADAFVGKFGNSTGSAVAATGAECTVGQVLLTASILRTAGGIPANGQLVTIAQNTELFSQIGTTYGGNGQTTFAVPDLRSIAPNNMTYSICAHGVFPV